MTTIANSRPPFSGLYPRRSPGFLGTPVKCWSKPNDSWCCCSLATAAHWGHHNHYLSARCHGLESLGRQCPATQADTTLPSFDKLVHGSSTLGCGRSSFQVRRADGEKIPSSLSQRRVVRAFHSTLIWVLPCKKSGPIPSYK